MLATLLGGFLDGDRLPNLHKKPKKSRWLLMLAQILLKSCFTVKPCYKYCETVYERNGKNLFRLLKKSGEILNELKSKGFLASNLSTYT